MNRGQITIIQLIGWGLAIAIPTVLASVSLSNSKFANLDESNVATVQRLSVVETKSMQYEKDISDINRKLDTLLLANGVRVK